MHQMYEVFQSISKYFLIFNILKLLTISGSGRLNTIKKPGYTPGLLIFITLNLRQPTHITRAPAVP